MTLLIQEIGWVEPEEAFLRWATTPYITWLDSGGPVAERAVYSYLALDPFCRLTVRDQIVAIDDHVVDAPWFEALESLLRRWRMPPADAPTPFIGGAVGYFGYELVSGSDGPSLRQPKGPDIADLAIGFYDLVLGFDRAQRRCWIMSSGFPAEGEARIRRAQERSDMARARLSMPLEAPSLSEISALDWHEDVPKADYQNRVRQIIRLIEAGDIYQANFSAPHWALRPPALRSVELYRHLRRSSPAPFGAYLDCGNGVMLASSSPERFLAVTKDGEIETRPIKGTRPRGIDALDDERLKRDLQDSAKDHAENLMIVDLMRNDLGRVAKIGSVAVRQLCAIESFARVHHLVSSITAHLRDDNSVVDLLRATLPGGSVTGAPKWRAMEIIDAMETSRRGPYCGSLAWIGFDGAMDSSILIRTLVLTADKITANAGGGVVADSDPEAEYEEMLVKIRPLLLGRSE